MSRLLLASLLAATASLAVAEPTPKEKLLTPPDGARYYIFTSDAGKHADPLDAVMDEQKVTPAKRPAVVKAPRAPTAQEAKPRSPVVPLAAAMASGHVGQYIHSETELASGLWLKADGTFEYFLTVGSLDETASGRWTATGERIALVNDPVPVPPTITPGATTLDPAAGFSLKVVLPSGDGAQGVDVMVGFDRGEPAEGYTQTDGWALPIEEKRQPRWVKLTVPSYGLASVRFPVDGTKANALTFILTPNDIGVVDLRETSVIVKENKLLLVREGRTMQFERERP